MVERIAEERRELVDVQRTTCVGRVRRVSRRDVDPLDDPQHVEDLGHPANALEVPHHEVVDQPRGQLVREVV